MKVLVIKQTSLGDVLHATGHVRAIRQHWPGCELHLLSATSSADIFRNSPWVDKLIMVDRYRVKKNWYREPRWSFNHMAGVMAELRRHRYTHAFDLQGLAKSVIFLYGAHAEHKYVKGNWPALRGFRNPQLNALDEMDGVLALAGITGVDTRMEFPVSQADRDAVDSLLKEIGHAGRRIIIISPFSRWQSKDWSLGAFMEVAQHLVANNLVLFSGAADRSAEIDRALAKIAGNEASSMVNVAGRLSLTGFAELVRRAALMVTGDSFPMHVASACATPLIALFGPTDETRVGPRGDGSLVVRAPDCNVCDRRDCQRRCLDRILPSQVITSALEMLDRR